MTDKRQLAVLGASGHGKVCADIAEQLGYDVHFFDKRYGHMPATLSKWPVVGGDDALIELAQHYHGFFIAIGDNAIRMRCYEGMVEQGLRPVTLVSPSACISPFADIGPGSVVMPNAVVNADAVIAQGAIINTSAIVEHDCVLGRGVHISPGACLSGGVKVGSLSWVGCGASVIQLINIGAGSIVGAGATVIRDVPCATTVVGNPAQIKEAMV